MPVDNRLHRLLVAPGAPSPGGVPVAPSPKDHELIQSLVEAEHQRGNIVLEQAAEVAAGVRALRS